MSELIPDNCYTYRVDVEKVVLSKDELSLIMRYRQAKAQGLRILVDADAGELQVLGKREKFSIDKRDFTT